MANGTSNYQDLLNSLFNPYASEIMQAYGYVAPTKGTPSITDPGTYVDPGFTPGPIYTPPSGTPGTVINPIEPDPTTPPDTSISDPPDYTDPGPTPGPGYTPPDPNAGPGDDFLTGPTPTPTPTPPPTTVRDNFYGGEGAPASALQGIDDFIHGKRNLMWSDKVQPRRTMSLDEFLTDVMPYHKGKYGQGMMYDPETGRIYNNITAEQANEIREKNYGRIFGVHPDMTSKAEKLGIMLGGHGEMQQGSTYMRLGGKTGTHYFIMGDQVYAYDYENQGGLGFGGQSGNFYGETNRSDTPITYSEEQFNAAVGQRPPSYRVIDGVQTEVDHVTGEPVVPDPQDPGFFSADPGDRPPPTVIKDDRPSFKGGPDSVGDSAELMLTPGAGTSPGLSVSDSGRTPGLFQPLPLNVPDKSKPLPPPPVVSPPPLSPADAFAASTSPIAPPQPPMPTLGLPPTLGQPLPPPTPPNLQPVSDPSRPIMSLTPPPPVVLPPDLERIVDPRRPVMPVSPPTPPVTIPNRPVMPTITTAPPPDLQRIVDPRRPIPTGGGVPPIPNLVPTRPTRPVMPTPPPPPPPRQVAPPPPPRQVTSGVGSLFRGPVMRRR